MHAFRTHHRRQEGFGIVVVALLFTAFAVIAATMIDRGSAKLELDRQQQVEAQLSRLNIALLKYARYTDHRFPCPASMELLPNNVAFGAAAPQPPSRCDTGLPAAGTAIASSSGNKLITGMVPVRDLVPYGISYNEAFDPWGSRIMYAVHRDLTTGTSDATAALASNAERALVTDYVTGQIITPGPDAVLISFGRDRMGGRLRSQAGALTAPSIACSGSERRHANCNGDREFLRGPLAIGSRTPTTVYFDDTVSAIRYSGAGTGGCFNFGEPHGGNAANCCVGYEDTDGDGYCGGHCYANYDHSAGGTNTCSCAFTCGGSNVPILTKVSTSGAFPGDYRQTYKCTCNACLANGQPTGSDPTGLTPAETFTERGDFGHNCCNGDPDRNGVCG